MGAPIRLTAAETAWLTSWLSKNVEADREHGDKAATKIGERVLEKLEKSELVKGKGRPAGLGWNAAAAAMRGVLGAKLAVPPNPDIGWIMKMSNRIRDLGLVEEHCERIARALERKGWRTYSFEKAIWEADRLLAESDSQPEKPKTASAIPVGPEDIA